METKLYRGLRKDPVEALWGKVAFDGLTGCWKWVGYRNPAGYGMVGLGPRGPQRRPWLAHRVFYTLLVGPIPDSLQLDHLCRVRACVNPAHLEPVTNAENHFRARGLRKPKLKCRQGHLLSEDNVIVATSARGVERRCRTCAKENWTKQNAKRVTRKLPNLEIVPNE